MKRGNDKCTRRQKRGKEKQNDTADTAVVKRKENASIGKQRREQHD